MRFDAVHARAVDLLFAGSVFCDLVFAGVPCPSPGRRSTPTASSSPRAASANRAVAAIPVGARDRAALPARRRPARPPHRRAARRGARPRPALACAAPGLQSPVTVSLTGVHEREFITYEEARPPRVADRLSGPRRRDPRRHRRGHPGLGGATARSRHRGLRRRRLGLQRRVVRRGARPPRRARRLRAQRRRSHALHPDRRRRRRGRAARPSSSSWPSSPGVAHGVIASTAPGRVARGAVGQRGRPSTRPAPATCSSPPSWPPACWTGTDRRAAAAGRPAAPPCPSARSGSGSAAAPGDITQFLADVPAGARLVDSVLEATATDIRGLSTPSLPDRRRRHR